MIKMTGAAALGATVLGLPAVASDNGRIVDTNRRKILVIGDWLRWHQTQQQASTPFILFV